MSSSEEQFLYLVYKRKLLQSSYCSNYSALTSIQRDVYSCSKHKIEPTQKKFVSHPIYCDKCLLQSPKRIWIFIRDCTSFKCTNKIYCCAKHLSYSFCNKCMLHKYMSQKK